MPNNAYQIVIDTNVIIAATRSKLGASAALLAMVGDGTFELNLSVALALEYEEVLRRDVVGANLSSNEIFDLVAFLCVNSRRWEVVGRLRPLVRDPDDEFIAELVFASSCDFLVTHNVRDFATIVMKDVRVVTPKTFLAMIRGLP